MALGPAAVQVTLELHNLGYFKKSSSVIEIGSQELHLKNNDLKEFFDYAGLQSNLVDVYPNIDNYPNQPRCTSKYFYQSLGFKEYECIDINTKHNAIKHDLNKPFKDESKFNKFDLVTDFGACEHVFNIAECYTTMHNLTKPGGYIFIAQGVLNSNGYFLFDSPFIEGMAMANNYKIIYNCYCISTRTENGTSRQFNIPMSKTLFNVINFGKVKSVSVYAVLQKQNEDKFIMPSLENQFQPNMGRMKEGHYNFGFNRMYFKDPLGYSIIPSPKLTIEETPFKLLVKEFFRRLLKKIR